MNMGNSLRKALFNICAGGIPIDNFLPKKYPAMIKKSGTGILHDFTKLCKTPGIAEEYVCMECSNTLIWIRTTSKMEINLKRSMLAFRSSLDSSARSHSGLLPARNLPGPVEACDGLSNSGVVLFDCITIFLSPVHSRSVRGAHLIYDHNSSRKSR